MKLKAIANLKMFPRCRDQNRLHFGSHPVVLGGHELSGGQAGSAQPDREGNEAAGLDRKTIRYSQTSGNEIFTWFCLTRKSMINYMHNGFFKIFLYKAHKKIFTAFLKIKKWIVKNLNTTLKFFSPARVEGSRVGKHPVSSEGHDPQPTCRRGPRA